MRAIKNSKTPEQYRNAHKDETKAYYRQYRNTHQNQIKIYKKRYRDAHKDKIRAYNEMYMKLHPGYWKSSRIKEYKHNYYLRTKK